VRRRLRETVIRPLREAVDGAGAGSDIARLPQGTHEGRLWHLARAATELRARLGDVPGLQEATAALQDLAIATADEATASRLLAEFIETESGLGTRIAVAENGPYLVTNPTRLTDWLGEPVPVRPQLALCRCGGSATKPLCDGSHATNGFDGAKSHDRVADRRDTYVGQQVSILDNRGTCQHSGYCTDRLATVFHLGEEPFVTPSGGRMDEIIRAVRDCPSGALSYAIDRREARGQVDFDCTRGAAIEVTKDGPYRITGGIPVVDSHGDSETRNDGASSEHYALCRCGHSRNKPFCSGMHWYVEFHDPQPPPDRAPTVFEWCGGLPALTRMTRLFYEKYVPQDPLLAPLFATMSADHPERVAKWLGEVFCGPKAYSQEYGGYERMISQHVGKGLTEAQRARWVSLLLQASHEAGLPNDPEWRSCFGAYIEWGSRLAVENSQLGAHPPTHMPVPHWGWQTAAGPPGARVSASPTGTENEEAAVVLPVADEPVRFETHVRPMFRAVDRRSMTFAFDLWSYDDVARHADGILARLQAGTMPCDGAWPEARVAVFQRWVDTGRAR